MWTGFLCSRPRSGWLSILKVATLCSSFSVCCARAAAFAALSSAVVGAVSDIVFFWASCRAVDGSLLDRRSVLRVLSVSICGTCQMV